MMAGGEEFRESRGKRDLAGLPALVFERVTRSTAAIEVDVLKALTQETLPAASRYRAREHHAEKRLSETTLNRDVEVLRHLLY